MNNKVNVTQIALLMLLVITGGKFLSLPSILAKDVGHDSWLVLCINFLFDAVTLCFLLWAVRLNKKCLGLDVILNKTVSPVVSKLVLTIFFVMFISRTILLLDSCYNTFAVTFDVNTNWILFVLPIVAVAGFAIARGFNSVARTAQILFALVIFSIIAILIYPTTETDFADLLPVGEAGFGKLMGVSFLRSFWFSDYIFIYFVLEDLQPRKHLFSPVLTSFAVGVVLTVLLNAVFVALFGDLAKDSNLAMSKIGLFSVSESADGRWDWLTLTMWLTSVIIKIVIFIFCAYKCVEKIFEQHFAKINFIVLGVIGLCLLLPMVLSVSAFLDEFLYRCVIPFAVVQYLLPLAMPLLTKTANKRLDEQSKLTLQKTEAENAQS